MDGIGAEPRPQTFDELRHPGTRLAAVRGEELGRCFPRFDQRAAAEAKTRTGPGSTTRVSRSRNSTAMRSRLRHRLRKTQAQARRRRLAMHEPHFECLHAAAALP